MAQYLKRIENAPEKAAERAEARAATTKHVKLSRPGGNVNLSVARGRKRARRQRNANRAQGGPLASAEPRSDVAGERMYYRGPTGTRGIGRVTGVTATGTPTSRADLLKVPERGRFVPVGVTKQSSL